jgi:hypothetical protein
MKSDKRIINNESNPPTLEINKLIDLYHEGKYDVVEKLALALTKKYPDHQFGWKVLGLVLI